MFDLYTCYITQSSRILLLFTCLCIHFLDFTKNALIIRNTSNYLTQSEDEMHDDHEHHEEEFVINTVTCCTDFIFCVVFVVVDVSLA